jgi:hypothetical protein
MLCLSILTEVEKFTQIKYLSMGNYISFLMLISRKIGIFVMQGMMTIKRVFRKFALRNMPKFGLMK